MTDSNGDLVGKTALAICLATRGSPEFVSPEGQDALRCEARAAIAAVLDDLTQDAKSMALDRTLDLLDLKRKELGL